MSKNTKTVQLKVSISGSRDGADWPPRGGVIDLPVAEADDLIRAGFAVEPEEPSVKAPVEKATAPKGETRKGLTKASTGLSK